MRTSAKYVAMALILLVGVTHAWAGVTPDESYAQAVAALKRDEFAEAERLARALFDGADQDRAVRSLTHYRQGRVFEQQGRLKAAFAAYEASYREARGIFREARGIPRFWAWRDALKKKAADGMRRVRKKLNRPLLVAFGLLSALVGLIGLVGRADTTATENFRSTLCLLLVTCVVFFFALGLISPPMDPRHLPKEVWHIIVLSDTAARILWSLMAAGASCLAYVLWSRFAQIRQENREAHRERQWAAEERWPDWLPQRPRPCKEQRKATIGSFVATYVVLGIVGSLWALYLDIHRRHVAIGFFIGVPLCASALYLFGTRLQTTFLNVLNRRRMNFFERFRGDRPAQIKARVEEYRQEPLVFRDFALMTNLESGTTRSLTKLSWRALCERLRIPELAFDMANFERLKRRWEDAQEPLKVFWNEAARKDKHMRSAKRECSHCNGKGTIFETRSCFRCRGWGKEYIVIEADPWYVAKYGGEFGDTRTCPACRGAGTQNWDHPCSSCEGKGHFAVYSDKQLRDFRDEFRCRVTDEYDVDGNRT